MQKNILFLFVPICLIFSCRSDSDSFNDIVKKASEIKEDTPTPEVTYFDSTGSPVKLNEGSEGEEKVDLGSKESKVSEKEVKKENNSVAPEKPNNKPARASGIMTFDNRVHEFGTIEEGDIIKHDFYFTNTGKEPITVKKASATCGCTVPSYPFIPINPGEKGYIGVTYNSIGKSGVQTPVVTVVSDSKEKTIRLKLTGEVVEKTEESAEKPDTTTLPQ